MTSLFGRLLPLFGRQRKVEDLFTEAVALVFEKNPRLCLEWLGHEELISPELAGDGVGRVRVQTQKPLVATDTLDSAGSWTCSSRSADRPRAGARKTGRPRR